MWRLGLGLLCPFAYQNYVSLASKTTATHLGEVAGLTDTIWGITHLNLQTEDNSSRVL